MIHKSNTIFKRYFFSIIFILNCFGSEGNSLKERAVILSRIMDIYNSSDLELKNTIQFLDDQSDSALNEFQISSQGTIYNIKLDTTKTKFTSLVLDYYLDPPSLPLNVKHTGDTTTTSTSSNFQSLYVHRTNEDVLIASSPNANDETGSIYSYSPKTNAKLKRGILKKFVFEPKTISLVGELTETKTIPFQIEFQNPIIEKVLSCKINMNPSFVTMNHLRFRITSLFKDQTGSPILAQIHNQGISGTMFFINKDQNSSLYNEILKNLSSKDLIQEKGCN
ncbi:MAG: hypothetical protein SFU98_13640 [Leptospiraceae bacterium]|nr:hypothetical protein [Leptospiraceae bacterium]